MNQVFLKLLGTNIAKRRKDQRITQLSLSHACGIDLSYISRIECGKTNPSLEALYKISTALNCTVKDLIPDNND